MAIVTNGRLEYEMSTIDVTYPDIGKVTYTGSTPCIVPNNWAPPVKEYTDCLTFTGEDGKDFGMSATYQSWDGTLEWSTDHSEWKTFRTSTVHSANGKLYLRGSGNTTFNKTTYHGVQMWLSARVACSGNIQTLLQYDNPPEAITERNCFDGFFYANTKLIKAPDLPATTLAYGSYLSMFNGCTNLQEAPELPALTLNDSCYQNMFDGCTSLTTTPEFPATTLKSYCYYQMFKGCTNLTSIKELEAATALDRSSYHEMFSGCSKLKVNTESGTKIFTCPEYTAYSAVTDMFYGTGGSFTGTPTAGTTYYYTE